MHLTHSSTYLTSRTTSTAFCIIHGTQSGVLQFRNFKFLNQMYVTGPPSLREHAETQRLWKHYSITCSVLHIINDSESISETAPVWLVLPSKRTYYPLCKTRNFKLPPRIWPNGNKYLIKKREKNAKMCHVFRLFLSLKYP